ncbi:MAG TPA: hypothetical protein VE172_12960 [Stackebrandtia sp.]|nr:hypothetical protein [Stackebrandtia sp.]
MALADAGSSGTTRTLKTTVFGTPSASVLDTKLAALCEARIAITGHRDLYGDTATKLRDRISKPAEGEHPRGLSCLADGADAMFAADQVIRLDHIESTEQSHMDASITMLGGVKRGT